MGLDLMLIGYVSYCLFAEPLFFYGPCEQNYYIYTYARQCSRVETKDGSNSALGRSRTIFLDRVS